VGRGQCTVLVYAIYEKGKVNTDIIYSRIYKRWEFLPPGPTNTLLRSRIMTPLDQRIINPALGITAQQEGRTQEGSAQEGRAQGRNNQWWARAIKVSVQQDR